MSDGDQEELEGSVTQEEQEELRAEREMQGESDLQGGRVRIWGNTGG